MSTFVFLLFFAFGIIFADKLTKLIDRYARCHPFLRNIPEEQRLINVATLRAVLGVCLIVVAIYFATLYI